MKRGSVVSVILISFFILLFASSVAALGFLWWRQSGHFPKNFPNFANLGKENKEKNTVEIIAPADGTVFLPDKKTITVSGVAVAKSVVSVIGKQNEILTVADDAGNFETSLDLVDGINLISAQSIDKSDQKTEKTIAVLLSTKSTQLTATTAAGSLGIVADQKMFWGKIKGILKNNITLSGGNEEKEISAAAGAAFQFPDRKPDPDTDSLPDIKKVNVGDFIFATGSVRENTMSAIKVTIYKTAPTLTSSLRFGTVTKVDGTDESIDFSENGTKVHVFWNKSSRLTLDGKVGNFPQISRGSKIYALVSKNSFGNLIVSDTIVVSTPPEASASPKQ